MKNVNYEKPNMNFVNLRNDQAVAADDGPCMPQASHGHTQFYYDAPGDGWVIITANGENCSGKASFLYYDNPNIDGTASLDEQQTAISKAQAALGDNKQTFTGAYLDPQPSWS